MNNLIAKRDYIYIDDVCEAIHKSIYLKQSKITIDIGTGKSYSVKQVITTIAKYLNKDISNKIVNKNIFKSDEIFDSKAKLSKTKKYIKWVPKHSLLEGSSSQPNFLLFKLPISFLGFDFLIIFCVIMFM